MSPAQTVLDIQLPQSSRLPVAMYLWKAVTDKMKTSTVDLQFARTPLASWEAKLGE